MKPPSTDPVISLVLIHLLEDLTRIYQLATIIESTEHVQTGTEEWDRREQGKALFEEGVVIMNHAFDIMKTW